MRFTELTVTVLVVPLDHALRLLPSDVEPLAGVGQILVLDRQVFGQNALAVRQPVRVRTEQPVLLVLFLVVAVTGRENVVVEFHHGYNAGVQQVLGRGDRRIRVLPDPRQHVGTVHGHVGHHPEPFLENEQQKR